MKLMILSVKEVQCMNKWDKLREWVKDYKDALENDVDTLHGADLFEEHVLMILDEILAIMNSLDLGEKL